MYSQQSSPAATARRIIATRQRVSRACDRCNHLRVKCDGQRPCEHCLVYGLECKYDRQQKKRGKGSLANSTKENFAASSDAFVTPITTKNSPASSPGSFHLSIPPSHLYNGGIVDHKDSFQTEFTCVPSNPQLSPTLQENFCKAEQESSVDFMDERCQSEDPANIRQRLCLQVPESACYAAQVWSRSSSAFDSSKTLSPPNTYSTPPANYGLLPYVPICASCQTNPSMRLYPGSVVWLPAVPLQHHAALDYGAVIGEEGTYCFPESQRVMAKDL